MHQGLSLKRWLLAAGLVFAAAPAGFAQSPRLNDAHSLAWLVYVGDHKIADKWAVHTEYQWRRVDFLRDPQQQLARLGLVRTLSERVKVSGGYTYFQSHRYCPYAEVPGRAEPENRIYEDVSLQDQLGRLGLSQRLRLEQRWLGARPDRQRPGAGVGLPKPHPLPTRSRISAAGGGHRRPGILPHGVRRGVPRLRAERGPERVQLEPPGGRPGLL